MVSFFLVYLFFLRVLLIKLGSVLWLGELTITQIPSLPLQTCLQAHYITVNLME